jgi:hypothetical protein
MQKENYSLLLPSSCFVDPSQPLQSPRQCVTEKQNEISIGYQVVEFRLCQSGQTMEMSFLRGDKLSKPESLSTTDETNWQDSNGIRANPATAHAILSLAGS